ncbi:hypothetical protein PVAND_001847 [Polypedilum vanderplanki]|uniref:Peptidase S1 domain-containing protein n=1 Tax=Polypedilum vanderplanki TaxID=319348 RepID=A0A9J6BP58_POLVA|nr:hypothetical protein PVAND_001847 [Polypedilum vanderplanki]
MLLFLLLFCIIKYSSQECGIAITSNFTNKIHFPWIAEIFSKVNKTETGNDKRLCGSTIISAFYAITASHCFQEKNSDYKRSFDEVYLLANIIDLKQIDETYRIELKEVIIHPKWNVKNSKYEGDITLLQFKDNLSFNENIQPICLSYEGIEKIPLGKVISFIDLEKDDPGYYNHHYDKIHNYAQLFEMSIRSECTVSQPRFNEIATNKTFCAGGSGPCLETGTSGSGMVVEKNGRFYLRGIVSASFIDFTGCDNYTYTLFTDVLKYKDWIERIIFEI